MGAYQWFGAWLLFIILLIAIAQIKAGRTILYYLLWLAVVLLVVSHYQEITNMFAGAGIIPAQNNGVTNA